ncbi:cyclic phosphodiesterase-like [Tasmannia lanceolata]|uniref:cyclic phosphodiesterase-like n=1 Tax=Tasmannia lanceolata TaxID=3420 RepID=UPI004063FDCC
MVEREEVVVEEEDEIPSGGLSTLIYLWKRGGGEETGVYSVWAIPPEPVKSSRLKKLMENLISEFRGPEFEPHVPIRLTQRHALLSLQSTCQPLKPYNARINTVSRGGFFYQCVYPEVMEASAHSAQHFGYQSSNHLLHNLFRHLSLLYGDLTDDEKEKAEERAKFLDRDLCNLSFEVSSLTLYKTNTEDKTLKSWGKVADCNLLHGN